MGRGGLKRAEQTEEGRGQRIPEKAEPFSCPSLLVLLVLLVKVEMAYDSDPVSAGIFSVNVSFKHKNT